MQEAFDRLNRNVAKLNAQELRHARFSGAFISLMETLADDPFWKETGIVTPARIRRMIDVEFVSEIFILTMRGVQNGTEELDQAYADYDAEIPDAEVHRAIFEQTKDLLKGMWPALTTTRFRNLADFYGLWTACLAALRNNRRLDIPRTGRALSEFAESVREDAAAPEAQRYLLAAAQGSNKASNRQLRADLLYALFADAANQ